MYFDFNQEKSKIQIKTSITFLMITFKCKHIESPCIHGNCCWIEYEMLWSRTKKECNNSMTFSRFLLVQPRFSAIRKAYYTNELLYLVDKLMSSINLCYIWSRNYFLITDTFRYYKRESIKKNERDILVKLITLIIGRPIIIRDLFTIDQTKTQHILTIQNTFQGIIT